MPTFSLPLSRRLSEQSGETEAFCMGMEKQIAGYPKQLAPHLELRRVLGEGGSSIVFEAFHTRLKVPVAVKLLSVRGALAGHAGERLLREAELYALLDDPRIPRVYDVDELENGTPYVVMEFVPGGSLEFLLTRGPLSPRRAVTIAREVLAALVYVHSKGVLHRDVKPANVILNEVEGGRVQVRLVDFGIAKVFDDVPANGGPLTQQGTLVGTPHYMAPERLLGNDADERADIYSVGVMLYEMLTGNVPFSGPTLGEVIAAVLRDTPAPLNVYYPQIIPELAQVVTRAMERNLGARFQTAREMLEALGQLETLLSGEVSSPRIVSPQRAMSSRPPARPLSFPSLELTREDLYPSRQRSSSLLLPMAMIALAGVVAWSTWSERGNALVGYLRGQYGEANVEQGPTNASAATLPSELAPGAPSAALPLEGLFWDAPRRLVRESKPRSLLLDPAPASGVGELGETDERAAAVEDEQEASEPEPAQVPAAPTATPESALSAQERELRQRIRVRDEGDEEEPGRYYEPSRSVPLQPVMENIEHMLREAVPPPPPSSAPLPRRVDEAVPANPYVE